MMIEDSTIQEMVNEAVAKFLEAAAAGRCASTPTADQQLAQVRFRELVTEHALLHGVRPKAIRLVVREAQSVFDMHAGALVPRHHETDPADPLAPLTPARWLQELAKTDGYLFAPPGRTH